MRIQHNIMAMNAYRNYNLNNKALSGNLEKLSSGYKINRAGDDAAGLAISEKMRAQITGLQAAQKNVKDGISLVKTAEGAMQEIQDMLNRMDYLATQSANGTYDNEVDRANLQKEVDALKTEINRIADSANFNGIKLLDGSLDENVAASTTTTTTGGEITNVAILPEVATDPTNEVGTKTVLHGQGTEKGKTEINIATHNTSVTGQKGDTIEVTVGDAKIKLSVTGTEDLSKGQLKAGTTYTGEKLAEAIAGAFNTTTKTIGGQAFTASTTDDGVKFEQNEVPTKESEIVNANVDVAINRIPSAAGGSVKYTVAISSDAVREGSTITIGDSSYKLQGDKSKLSSLTSMDAATIGGYKVYYSAGKLTVEDSTGLLGKPEVKIDSFDAPTTLTPALQEDGKAAVNTATAATGRITGVDLTKDKTITVGGQTYKIPDLSSVTGANASSAFALEGSGTASYSITAYASQTEPGKYNLEIKTVDTGAKANGEVEFKDMKNNGQTVQLTGGEDTRTATKGKTVFDLSGLKEGDHFAIGSAEFVYDGSGDFTNLKSIDGNTTLKDAVQTQTGNTETVTGTKFGEIVVESATAAGTASLAPNVTIQVYSKTDSGNTYDLQEPADMAGITGTLNVQSTLNKQGGIGGATQLASTAFDLTNDIVKDGNVLTIGKQSYIFKVGADSETTAADGQTLIDLSAFEDGDEGLIDAAGKALSNETPNNSTFTIGYAKDNSGKISIHEKQGQTDYEKELQSVEEFDKLVYVTTATSTSETTTEAGKPLTLQIGDTSEEFNQMKVSVGDMHVDAMKLTDEKTGESTSIADIDISNQEGAATAVDVIKNAINYVSSVRGDLGAIQNRLDHTANNLSVMAENIQDAESTIRDTDVAEEMMSYVKNNILVQSAQAMLAQANQLPQGVLQLLG